MCLIYRLDYYRIKVLCQRFAYLLFITVSERFQSFSSFALVWINGPVCTLDMFSPQFGFLYIEKNKLTKMHPCMPYDKSLTSSLVKWMWGGYKKVNTGRRCCSVLLNIPRSEKLLCRHGFETSYLAFAHNCGNYLTHIQWKLLQQNAECNLKKKKHLEDSPSLHTS